MMIVHHEKYKEIHGEDKTVLMDAGEHRRLHNRLNFRVPRKIKDAAHCRTEKHKQYRKEAYQSIEFNNSVSKGWRELEDIFYNKITGTVTIVSRFRPNPNNT